MARKLKAQLHPAVAAALPVAVAAMEEGPAPMRRGRKARPDGAVPAGAPRREGPHRNELPTTATTASVPGNNAPTRRLPKRRTLQPEAMESDMPGHEAAPQRAGAVGTGPVLTDTASAMPGGDAQPPLPGPGTPSPTRPAVQWDRAMETLRFDWPAIERTATADGPNQGMAKLLVAARAAGANSRWPL